MKHRHPLPFLVIAAGGVLLMSCGSDRLGPVERFRIEAMAEVQDSLVVWDPNDRPTLYAHVVGISDAEAADLIWTQTGLAVDDSGWRGPQLALNAGGEGCGYGGVTFTLSAISPDDDRTASLRIRIERYVCSGSPWSGE